MSDVPNSGILPISVDATAERFRAVIEPLQRQFHGLLQPGVHLQVVPNIASPIFTKAAAEYACLFFGLTADYNILDSKFDPHYEHVILETVWEEAEAPRDDKTKIEMKKAKKGRFIKVKKGRSEEWQWQVATGEVEKRVQGLVRFTIECKLAHRDTGRCVWSALGVASSLESKFANRPHEADNTVLQVACKRGLVQAILGVTGLNTQFGAEDGDEKAAESVATDHIKRLRVQQPDYRILATRAAQYPGGVIALVNRVAPLCESAGQFAAIVDVLLPANVKDDKPQGGAARGTDAPKSSASSTTANESEAVA